ncbi:MAG: four helix bundle protein [Candidatus Margulisiibacteriota bacterium]|nr:four helix bundle protein [Candidatus Margulisiibacteriota bacterium]
MTFRFLKFPVYADIKKYIKNIYSISSQFPKEEQFGMINQLRRAATSIALNLAEGSDRGSDKDFKRFINMSIGSLNETVAVLDLSLGNGRVKSYKNLTEMVIVKSTKT